MASGDVGALRKVAEAATPGPWHARLGLQVRGPEGTVACWDCCGGNPHHFESTQEHIATFDPPTVLGLLDRLEAAEAKVARVEDLADWYDAQVNWREWRIGATLRAALTEEGR